MEMGRTNREKRRQPMDKKTNFLQNGSKIRKTEKRNAETKTKG